MACGFSNFRQLFAEGEEFSHDLSPSGAYKCAYMDIMSHWDAALPGRAMRVQHEDDVAELHVQLYQLLDYCGLPFETGCLRFYETERADPAPSSEQVRRHISRTGLGLGVRSSRFSGHSHWL